jgi:hypothetical protein
MPTPLLRKKILKDEWEKSMLMSILRKISKGWRG